MKKLIYLLIVPILLISGCVNEDEPPVVSVEPGTHCPSFSVVMADGTTLSTTDLQGHKSMIVFFNTSCSDCQKELPVIQQVYEELSETGSDSRIVCIARAEGKESIEKFWQEKGLTLPYSPQPDREIYNLFATSVIPRTYVVSADLTITQCWDDNPMPSFSQLIEALR